jgi:D-3-phosphoglycerate dehydrogenase
MDSAMKAGEWKRYPLHAQRKDPGVVGVGNVGKAVLRRARAFGMKLLGNDIVEISPGFFVGKQRECVSLRSCWSGRFISLKCCLPLSSFHLMNADSFGWCKPARC